MFWVIADHHWQLHHVFILQSGWTHKAYDVALLSWSGSKVEHKARVDVGECINTQVAFEVVALVNNHHRIEMGYDLDE